MKRPVNFRNKKVAWERDPHDWYVEPRWCVDALFDRLELRPGESIWDPACGSGTIIASAIDHGLVARGTDLIDRSAHCDFEQDFLADHWPIYEYQLTIDNVVTNPPFKHAIEFVERGLQVARRRVVILARLAFLESERRMRFFERTPLSQVMVMGPRISMPPGHLHTPEADAQGGQVAFCWLVWDKQHRGDPTIGWLRRP